MPPAMARIPGAGLYDVAVIPPPGFSCPTIFSRSSVNQPIYTPKSARSSAGRVNAWQNPPPAVRHAARLGDRGETEGGGVAPAEHARAPSPGAVGAGYVYCSPRGDAYMPFIM